MNGPLTIIVILVLTSDQDETSMAPGETLFNILPPFFIVSAFIGGRVEKTAIFARHDMNEKSLTLMNDHTSPYVHSGRGSRCMGLRKEF